MKMRHHVRVGMALLSCLLLPVGGQAPAAEPHAYEAASTGSFRDQDSLPGAYLQRRQSDDGGGAWWGLGPGGGDIKRSSFRADAHEGVVGYGARSCVSCHEEERDSLHSSRANVTCVQCHRGKPIAGIYHYYSAMNPIRRHAYVCAKCHDGSNASFATFLIHEPSPLASSTAQEFPLLYYGVWFMVILAVGVFALFIPYVLLWGLRELIGLFEGRHSHG